MATTADDLNGDVVLGVDTHGQTHHAALIDCLGRHLEDAQFPVTPDSYRRLLAWGRRRGNLRTAGVEGTGSYGTGLARYLRSAGVLVIEVNRPDRSARRMAGKSDPLDAYAAARAVLNGSAAAAPKSRTGAVEAIRVLRVTRRGVVKARTQAINQLRALIVTAPEDMRERLAGLSAAALIRACAQLRPGTTGGELAGLHDPALAATKVALLRMARRYQQLSEEIAELDAEIRPLIRAAAPQLLALHGAGPQVAGQLLATAGDNPDRLRSEASFAHLCGVAPIPASSGRTRRHRLSRGGDRAANNALYTIVLTRLRNDPRTRAYLDRRTAEGLSKPEIIRCLKRHVAREVYRALPGTTDHPPRA
ncbi:MAG TPA: IS110 family transposase [Streptosporangiaceae bacterium]|nr:IS110 family transposase [Streptosporangiaceae bacterium]